MFTYTLFLNYETVSVHTLIMGAGRDTVGCDNVSQDGGFRVQFPVGPLKN